MSSEVSYSVKGRVGVATLDRPKAINALNQGMIDSLLEQLGAWAHDDQIAAVWLEGAGERGLCAGGDVRALREAALDGRPEEAIHFWVTEYQLNALISDYPKPFVAWMDGIVMGGGVGVSSHGSVRLVTERTQIAMPETIIGFFPDVGGLWFLAHAPGELGTHVAMTGVPVSGADAIVLGMADGLAASDAKDQLLAAVVTAVADPTSRLSAEDLLATLDGVVTDAEARAQSGLVTGREWIDACYAGDDASSILERLRASEEPQAREAAEAITARSPHSEVATLAALRRARGLDVPGVLEQDLRLGAVFIDHPDFAEGVRAQLVDKDRDPQWADASMEAVDRGPIEAALGGSGGSDGSGGPGVPGGAAPGADSAT